MSRHWVVRSTMGDWSYQYWSDTMGWVEDVSHAKTYSTIEGARLDQGWLIFGPGRYGRKQAWSPRADSTPAYERTKVEVIEIA